MNMDFYLKNIKSSKEQKEASVITKKDVVLLSQLIISEVVPVPSEGYNNKAISIKNHFQQDLFFQESVFKRRNSLKKS